MLELLFGVGHNTLGVWLAKSRMCASITDKCQYRVFTGFTGNLGFAVVTSILRNGRFTSARVTIFVTFEGYISTLAVLIANLSLMSNSHNNGDLSIIVVKSYIAATAKGNRPLPVFRLHFFHRPPYFRVLRQDIFMLSRMTIAAFLAATAFVSRRKRYAH